VWERQAGGGSPHPDWIRRRKHGSYGGERGHEDLDVRKAKETTATIRNYNPRYLWKGVEKQENLLRLWSGCAGDYEARDRTAWEEDLEDQSKTT
jgi:hypothetical protein